MTRGYRRSTWAGLKRLFQYRLIIPMKRNSRRPTYTARGIAVGLFWAFTPLIPIQSYLLILTWIVARRFPRLNFNLIVALAWIWVTNIFTVLPVYFAFYLTGLLMLGQWSQMTGYAEFTAHWSGVIETNIGIWATVQSLSLMVLNEQGLVLAVGCLPYALGSAWFGYIMALRFMRKFSSFDSSISIKNQPLRK